MGCNMQCVTQLRLLVHPGLSPAWLAQPRALTDLLSSASGKEGWEGQGGGLEGSPWLQHTGYHTSEITEKRTTCAVRGLKAVRIRRLL